MISTFRRNLIIANSNKPINHAALKHTAISNNQNANPTNSSNTGDTGDKKVSRSTGNSD